MQPNDPILSAADSPTERLVEPNSVGNDVAQNEITENKPNGQLPPVKKSRINRLIVVLIVVLVAFTLFALFVRNNKTRITATANTNSAKTVALSPAEINITDQGFVPATVTIKLNQGIIWTNNDTKSHQVASDPYPSDNALSGFNAKQPINQGDSYTFVFNKTGTYTYHDELNPYKINGTVIVKN
jgi:plastocyanin